MPTHTSVPHYRVAPPSQDPGSQVLVILQWLLGSARVAGSAGVSLHDRWSWEGAQVITGPPRWLPLPQGSVATF